MFYLKYLHTITDYLRAISTNALKSERFASVNILRKCLESVIRDTYILSCAI